jgi:uncharacterized protein
MIFVDTNIFVYAVGGPHQRRAEAQEFLLDAQEKDLQLVTSAEVLQELVHVYLPVDRWETLDAALELAQGVCQRIYPIETDDVLLARNLGKKFSALTSRDLLHLATSLRRECRAIKTFDRGLADAARRVIGTRKR